MNSSNEVINQAQYVIHPTQLDSRMSSIPSTSIPLPTVPASAAAAAVLAASSPASTSPPNNQQGILGLLLLLFCYSCIKWNTMA